MNISTTGDILEVNQFMNDQKSKGKFTMKEQTRVYDVVIS
tara:strand:+ start:381 stop:500 length:120 start_codon:yes stop_codon:yes gene_type:complete